MCTLIHLVQVGGVMKLLVHPAMPGLARLPSPQVPWVEAHLVATNVVAGHVSARRGGSPCPPADEAVHCTWQSAGYWERMHLLSIYVFLVLKRSTCHSPITFYWIDILYRPYRYVPSLNGAALPPAMATAHD